MSSNARETLIADLREHALVVGDVTLSSGATAQYYVDARRALLRPAGFRAAAGVALLLASNGISSAGTLRSRRAFQTGVFDHSTRFMLPTEF